MKPNCVRAQNAEVRWYSVCFYFVCFRFGGRFVLYVFLIAAVCLLWRECWFMFSSLLSFICCLFGSMRVFIYLCALHKYSFRALPMFFALFIISLSIILSIVFYFIRWKFCTPTESLFIFYSLISCHSLVTSFFSWLCHNFEYSYFCRFVDLYRYFWLLFTAKWRLVVYFVSSKSLNSISLSKRTKAMTKMNENKMTATTPKSFKSNETSWKLNILLDFIILYIYETVAFKARAFMQHQFTREFHASIETQSNWCHFWFALMNQNRVE